jgi:spore coat polysaccharide biosynthesis protein SpsF
MKTAILITARLKSVRLPLKVMKAIHGRPMICHLLDRLKLAERPSDIVVCTSPVAQDDPLEDVAREEGVQCFRGDPEDVLRRLTDAAREFQVDTAINCMADNPFTDPEYIDQLADFHAGNGHDFSQTEGLPRGAFTYAVSYPAMVRACEIKSERNTEIWGRYFTDTGLFKWGTLQVDDPDLRWPELRLTVDTPEDFELVTRVFDELYEPGKVFPLSDIVALCRRKPELPAINASILQRCGMPIKLKNGTQ